jgi:hypothetical protein
MITVEVQLANQHRARAYFLGMPASSQSAETIIAARYWDGEDQLREPVLRRILTSRNVRAVAYPTFGHRDVLQVFLEGADPDDLVLACVLVTTGRLRDMLAESSPIVEGFALQLMQGEQLSAEGIRAAVQAWVERCFPGVVRPSITVELWTGPEGIVSELIELLHSHPIEDLPPATAAEDAPGELEPDPALAQPPYEIAA